MKARKTVKDLPGAYEERPIKAKSTYGTRPRTTAALLQKGMVVDCIIGCKRPVVFFRPLSLFVVCDRCLYVALEVHTYSPWKRHCFLVQIQWHIEVLLEAVFLVADSVS
jgi:hypothetical protein